MNESQRTKDRVAQVAALRQAQERAARRRSRTIVGGSVAVAVGLVTVAGVVIGQEASRQSGLEAAAAEPIDGVEVFENLPQDHVQEPVTYAQTPPVGGEHAGVWTNCGIYTVPLSNEQTVHSMEHGAVWVTYRPDLPPAQLQQLTEQVATADFAVLSPFDGLAAPVVASAWGAQLRLDDPTDPRLDLFLRKYQQGEQTPEPGAPCTGGVDPA